MLAGLLGGGAGAAGRGIPVYREYTRPVVFYDETGQRAEWEETAPDRAARQALRETQAQEALMGKETLLEMSLGSGANLFGDRESPPAMVVPAPLSPMNRSRRRQEASRRNWLAESLEMPALGQSASNAAPGALMDAAQESGWDGLDNDASGSAALDPPSLELQMDEGGLIRELPDWSGREETDSLALRRWGAVAGGGGPEQMPEQADMGASLNESQAQSAYTRSMLRGEEAGSRVAAWNKTRSNLRGGLNQTRQMIADLSSRNGISSPGRETLFGGTAALESPRSRDENAGLALESLQTVPDGWSSSDGFTAGWGKNEQQTPGEYGRVQAVGVARQNTWRGGWNVQPAEGMAPEGRPWGGGSPVPASVDRSTGLDSRELQRPSTSSGGFKPAWY